MSKKNIPPHDQMLVCYNYNIIVTWLLWYACSLYRHIDRHVRPNFRDIILDLIEKEEVLKIPQSDLQTHPQSGSLGAPLKAGEGMYKDIQTHYL